MRYRDVVDRKRQQRELIKKFNKESYQREREAKGLHEYGSYYHRDDDIAGLTFYTKSGDIAELIKVDGDTLYIRYRGEYIKGSKDMIGKSIFLSK